ncbi:uncharacterized protein LOC127749992 [Frankliniella occidentalis]|uniref:Uncharacterized protein LOC127749992 n=1 Tax=Frankliniella occidentalis TaxID=133901 RepID=A0A9C6U9Y9_FRAOC|nr:uncharacterized protein LOC127749992 [Frankliniella occidentalis]
MDGNNPQDFKIFQDSVDNCSWATISISNEVGTSLELDNSDDVEESLDDTLPIEEVEELGGKNNKYFVEHTNINGIYQSTNMLPIRAMSAYAGESPAPKDMREFQPVYCSSSIQSDSAGSSKDSFEFSPPCCSSKLDNQLKSSNCGIAQHTRDTQQNPFANHHAPIIREIAKLNPCFGPLHNMRMGSAEFKPKKCSTALSESEFQIPYAPTGQQESSIFFAPLRCSTGITRSASMNHALPSAKADFAPHRCSTGLQDNSTAFIPLRCSTENNESAIFNPILSSTATSNDESNIPEFKYLRMGSEKR